MKKICLLTLLLTFSMGLFAESFTKNEYLLSAQDLLKQAELAFEEFRYEESLELVAKANAALDASHNYVRGSIIKTLASNSITKAKERQNPLMHLRISPSPMRPQRMPWPWRNLHFPKRILTLRKLKPMRLSNWLVQ